MKVSFKRAAALVLSVATVSAALASCGGLKEKYNDYDRTGEKYDYDLTEYISIPKYTEIEIPDISYTPDEEDIDNSRHMKLAYFAEEESVKEPCQKYDLVDADYSATLEDLNYTLFDSTVDNSRRSFMVGIGHFGVQEIDDAILGMEPGEEKTIDFTLPEPYYKDVLASGKSGTFTIKIDKVRRQSFDEYNDEFIQQYYGFGSVEEYDEEIVEQLTHDMAINYENYEQEMTWEYVYDNALIYKYPGKELNEARDSVVASYNSQAESEDMGFDEYIRSLGYESNADFYDNYVEPYARNLVKQDMIAMFIARCEGMVITDKQFDDAMLEYCEYYEVTDLETCEKVIVRDFGSREAFKEQIMMRDARAFLGDSAVKIDTAEYYKNKHEGKYELSEKEVKAASEPVSDDTLIIVLLSVIGGAVVIVIVVLIVKLAKAVKHKNEKLAEKAALEEKRRIRREMKAAKKNK